MKIYEQNAEMKATLAEVKAELRVLRAYLYSDKFTGTDNGERKDWISISELEGRLQIFNDIFIELENKGIQITKEETCQHDAQ